MMQLLTVLDDFCIDGQCKKSFSTLELLGKKLKGNYYDESGYTLSSSSRSGDDLKCDFESNCCWQNVKPPQDQLQFVIFEGDPDQDKMKQLFGTTDGPSGKYLVVATTSKPSPNDQAHFMSCPLTCTDDEIKVSLRYWISNMAKVRVCLRDIKGDSLFLNCQLLDKTSQPGPVEVTLPPMQNTHIVIVASNFSAKSVVMIDDIQVRASCKSTTFAPSTTPTPPTTHQVIQTDPTPPMSAIINDPSVNSAPSGSNQPDKNADLCKAVVCNFEDGTSCSYQQKPSSAMVNAQPKSWELATGLYKNPATGVRKPGEGDVCLAVYLKPRDIATIETTADFTDDRIIKFMVYKVVDKIELKGCCDDTVTCPYSTETNVQLKNYNKWQPGSFKCPKGTKKVIFQGNNLGDNEGAIGIDDIKLLLPNGGSSDIADQNAC